MMASTSLPITHILGKVGRCSRSSALWIIDLVVPAISLLDACLDAVRDVMALRRQDALRLQVRVLHTVVAVALLRSHRNELLQIDFERGQTEPSINMR